MCGEEGLRKGRTALPGQGGCVGSRSTPPPDCLLLLLVPSNSFLSLLCPFFAIRHQESSCLVCVLSVGQGWDGGAQSALADTHSLYLPRVFGQDGGCCELVP